VRTVGRNLLKGVAVTAYQDSMEEYAEVRKKTIHLLLE
jgi:hypothetical protein